MQHFRTLCGGGGNRRCKLHWARRLLGIFGSWVRIALGSCKYIGFWQSFRSLLQNLCLSVPFGWHMGEGASASTRGKCIKGGVSLFYIFIGQQLSRQWVLVKFCISLLCILTISPAGVLETDWRETVRLQGRRLCKGSSCKRIASFLNVDVD